MEKAEFDTVADQYEIQHRANVAFTGEDPSYFAEYKIAQLTLSSLSRHVQLGSKILDFGSGIGNSVPYFRKYFPNYELTCADASSRSIEISRQRFPGNERYLTVEQRIPVDDATYEIIFSACVFHHIPHEEHHVWLSELFRVTKPRGILSIFEHNPFNPLTVRAVNTCPFDENARLISATKLARSMSRAGWSDCRTKYHLFFPGFLSALRPAEDMLGWLPIGGQYSVTATKQ